MKHLFLLILAAACSLTAAAKPNLTGADSYRIVCSEIPNGCVVDGASFGQSTPLYYSPTATDADAAYWRFKEVSEGKYTIQNAATGQYVTYDGERIEASKRYVHMDTTLHGDSSLWTMTSYGNAAYAIQSALDAAQIWDVRRDSYMVGTHAASGAAANQLFSLVSKSGTTVQEANTPVVGQTGINVDSWLAAGMSTTEGWDNQKFWVNTSGHYTNGTASVTAPFIENWQDKWKGGLADSRILQTLTHLPSGSYTVTADLIAADQTGHNAPVGVYFVANDKQQSVRTGNGAPVRYSHSVTVTDGRLNTGLRLEGTNCNWVAIDNLHLFYNGSEEQLFAGEREKIVAEMADVYDATETQQHIDSIIAANTDATSRFTALEKYRKAATYLPKGGPLSRALSNLVIGKHGAAYDELYNTYLSSIPESHFGQSYTATVNYTQREGYGTLTIDGTPVTPGSSYTFDGITGERSYTLAVATPDNQTITAQITFTALPVVQIYGSFNNEYSNGYFRVYEPDAKEPQLLHAKAKWRGGITNLDDKHKRNYHVKLLDADGKKAEEKFFGLRKDNSWILESCQVDMARVRNRVLTDLWNDFATKPYYADREPKALSGSRGQFVELLLNGRYAGIYCMTEAMDRKQMKLKKYDEKTSTQHGLLWKSKDWSYSVFMGHETNSNYYPGREPAAADNGSETWDNYESKYPDFNDYNSSDWEPLRQAVNFVCTASDADFARDFGRYFDYPVVKDYYILMETILAADNHGKNMYFAVYDRQKDPKITLGVWDMDATLGQRWSDAYFHNTQIMNPERDYSEYITKEEHGDYNLFRRLRATNYNNFNEEVRQRYADLRKTYLSTEALLARFSTYFDRFKRCGAAARESRRWSGDSDIAGHTIDFDNEMEYLTNWVTRRMNYLDRTRFDIAALTGINRVADNSFSVNAYGQELVVTATQAAVIPVYSVTGKQVATLRVGPGVTTVNTLRPGIYIVANKKVVIR